MALRSEGGVLFGVGLLAYSVKANVETLFGVVGVGMPFVLGSESMSDYRAAAGVFTPSRACCFDAHTTPKADLLGLTIVESLLTVPSGLPLAQFFDLSDGTGALLVCISKSKLAHLEHVPIHRNQNFPRRSLGGILIDRRPGAPYQPTSKARGIRLEREGRPVSFRCICPSTSKSLYDLSSNTPHFVINHDLETS